MKFGLDPIDPGECVFRIMQYSHNMGVGVFEWLTTNGHGQLAICPVCHTEGFQHIEGCRMSPSAPLSEVAAPDMREGENS